MATLKHFIFILNFFTISCSFAQIDLEPYVGKSYKTLYNKIKKDSTFIGCRMLTSKPNKVNGVELYFKNNINYIISFKKAKLDDGYNCESHPIKGAKIYVIHKFKGTEYKEGYCRCTTNEQSKLIQPTLQK